MLPGTTDIYGCGTCECREDYKDDTNSSGQYFLTYFKNYFLHPTKSASTVTKVLTLP